MPNGLVTNTDLARSALAISNAAIPTRRSDGGQVEHANPCGLAVQSQSTRHAGLSLGAAYRPSPRLTSSPVSRFRPYHQSHQPLLYVVAITANP